MFCVIQEVEVKTVSAGEPKGFVVDETKVTWDGEGYTKYSYHYASERFERPIRKSYRISVHESQRENGKVKKKQTVICTVGYYDIVDWGGWIGDFITGGLKAKADILGLTEDALYYDVFGKLRIPEYLKKIKADFKAKKEYERRGREQYRSYYENFRSNYGGYSGGSYCGTAASNYNEADKAMLKKFYRILSKAFHPDSNQGVDATEEMKMLNRLKSDWGVQLFVTDFLCFSELFS